MPKEVANVLKKLKNEQTAKDEIDEMKSLFERIIKSFAPTGDLQLNKEDIIMAILIINSKGKIEELKQFLAKYPVLLNMNTFIKIFTSLRLYQGYPNFQDIVEKYASSNFFQRFFFTPDANYTGIGIDISSNQWETLGAFLRKNPNFIDDINSLKISIPIKITQLTFDFWREKNYATRLGWYDKDQTPFCNLKQNISKLLAIMYIDRKFLASFTPYLESFYNYLVENYNSAIKEFTNKERERRRNNNIIDLITKSLSSPEEIKTADLVLKLNATDIEKNTIVDAIIEHNRAIYEQLVQEYENAKQNSDENLSQLYARYGYTYETLSIDAKNKLKNMPYKTIEDFLKRLRNLGIFIASIEQVSQTKLEEIEDLIRKGIINKEWLKQNIDVIYSQNPTYDIIITNISILSKENINIIQYQNSLDILTSPHLKHSLDILNLYCLRITKATQDINFLSSQDLQKKIEFLYSIDFFANTNSLDILNYSLAEIHRLKIASLLNIPVSSIGDDTLPYDFSASMIPEDIRISLESELEIVYPIPDILDEYQIDNQTLNINGVLVSVEKVKRNLGKIGAIDNLACFYAIIFESFYTLEEISILRDALMPRDNNKSIRRS